MQCAGCSDFCVAGTNHAGDQYRIGANRCPRCGESTLLEIEDRIEVFPTG